MLGASEDGRASEPTGGARAPDPAALPLAKEDALRAPCSSQGALAQQVTCAEACLGGDTGSGPRPRAEVRGWGHSGPSQNWSLPPCLCQPKSGGSSSFIFCSGLRSKFAAFSLRVPRCLFLLATILLLTTPPCPHPVHTSHLGHDPLPLCQGTPVILAGADPSRAPWASSHPSLSPSLSPLSQREDAAELGGRLVNSLVDHGRNSDLSDIQEEEEEEEEEELGSTTCSFQKQVVGHSIRENGAKVMGGGGAGGP